LSVNPTEYLIVIKTTIVANPIIASHQITRQRSSNYDAYIRVIASFIDDSRLEIMEYARITVEDDMELTRYSYHWMDSDNNLLIRWDNAEHYPDLPNFPHHLHDGDEKNVVPGEPMTLSRVLDLIAERLEK